MVDWEMFAAGFFIFIVSTFLFISSTIISKLLKIEVKIPRF